ncbi:M50 family protein [Gordonia effusa NBRC 100432]|uniref:Zinc metalloprotease Rip1 n=1 Tax=Gordonia effusa NBRC 100432 TaxID=1077974 RepID=H0R266_9ACTN|nr:M50 family metallopeptidase [Gordonia effusa]GAB19171.1 M50 family protein [Gordonia effusa NBRC 100432]
MYLQKPWKRLVVLFAGPAQNFILGFVLIYVLAVSWGLPILNPDPTPAKVAEVTCVPSSTTVSTKAPPQAAPCKGTGPAAAQGLRAGDTIVEVNGQSISDYGQVADRIGKTSEPVAVTVDRAGQILNFTVVPQATTIITKTSEGTKSEQAHKIGVGFTPPPNVTHYNAASAIPGTFVFTGDLFKQTWDALLSMPSKVSGLWTAVTGGERALDTPVSAYGASVIGGKAVQNDAWYVFVLLLISINFFLGVFNLVPLLPLDGGHMAIVGYEKGRNTVRRWFGRTAAGPVDYMKLMPLTYAVVIVLGAFMVLTLTADIVNPIPVF